MDDGVISYEKQPALCFLNVQAAFWCFQTPYQATWERSFNGVKTDLCFAFPDATRIHAGFFGQAFGFDHLFGSQYRFGGIVDDVHNLSLRCRWWMNVL